MRRPGVSAALVALAVSLGGAGAQAWGQYVRRTPIVEAVQKTRKGIVTLRVQKGEGSERKDVVGTGVIVDERGYVVTNFHVVAGARRVQVHLHDGTVLAGEVHTEDRAHDLAILRVRAKKKLQSLTFGPSSDLLVGETVIAVGHPFGYTNTVSTGVVSAVGRRVEMPAGDVLSDLIQTTASINPGNSGGPLLNVNGELIGINVAFREGAQGIAFALNADAVQALLSKHLSAAKVARLAHGLACREEVRGEVPGSGGKARQAVVVLAVAGDGPAARAGLKRGDVLVRVGGRAVQNRFDVERALWGYKVGDRVEATVVRGGKELKVALTLGRDADGRAKLASGGARGR
jgi:serine protease Do